MRIIPVFFLTLSLLAHHAWAQDEQTAPRVRVKATGQAPVELPNAREAAIEDALRRCVEAGGGVELASVSQSEDFVLVSDVIYAKTAGFIEKYEVLEENRNQDGLFTVRVSAIVTRGNINTNVEAFKALLKRKGRPRVLIVGSADGKPFDARLTALLQGQLERKGIRVIDGERLTVQQRNDAERADKGDNDLKKAALIAKQLGADVLAVVNVEGESLGEQDVYGLKQHAVDAVGIVKLIRADTAEVLGSEVVEKRVGADTAERAIRKGSSEATTEAMNAAVRRIAMHWLEEVDQRGGQEVVVVMHKFAFKRSVAMIEKLRKVGGVKDVVIDRTDAEATGQIRVVTNSSAADVATVLTKLDATLQVISTSGNRVEVK